MAAVTQNSKKSERGVALNLVTANIDIAANGDTYVTGLKAIRGAVTNKPGSVTAMSFSGGTITFTTGGAVAGVTLTVFGK